MSKQIYRLSDSIEDDRPEIDFELPINGDEVDWLAVGEVLDGDRDATQWPNVALVVVHAEATDWDCYSIGGTLGMWSQRAIDSVGRAALSNFRLFPSTLNGERYWFLRCEHRIDCFDRNCSEWQPIPGKTNRVMKVHKYVFHLEQILDPSVFCVPDLRCQLFATKSVVESLQQSGCQGIEMLRLT